MPAGQRWWELPLVQVLLALGGLLGLVLGGLEVADRLRHDDQPPLTTEQSAIDELGCARDAARTVPVQGLLGVANVTDGDTRYSRSASADPGDTLQFLISVFDRSATDDLENLRARLLTDPEAQQSHIIELQLCGSNSVLVRDVVSVQTEVTNLELTFIEGTSNIRANVGGEIADRGGSDSLFTNEGESLGRLEAGDQADEGALSVAVRATVRQAD